jgi:hypothetical protein
MPWDVAGCLFSQKDRLWQGYESGLEVLLLPWLALVAQYFKTAKHANPDRTID